MSTLQEAMIDLAANLEAMEIAAQLEVQRRARRSFTFPTTEEPGPSQSGAVAPGQEPPKGLGTAGDKPLMRNREALDTRPAATGITAPDTLSA